MMPCRWAGLMRGAIAVALVYYYFDPKGMADDSHRSTIIATTLIVVLFSTVVFSAATKPLLEFMLGAGRPAACLTAHAPLYSCITVISCCNNNNLLGKMMVLYVLHVCAIGVLTMLYNIQWCSSPC